MKTSDYIASIIKKHVSHAFGVTGGCIVNLVDSMHRLGINTVKMHHEQSAAIAADAYARFNPLGVCYGTSGPGVTNLLTGTCCSYFDSIPVLTLGGQVPSHLLDGIDRQTGFQEVDGVSLFRPVTKLAKRYKCEDDLLHCINMSSTPRFGPTFLEIPDDIQRKEISPTISPRYFKKSINRVIANNKGKKAIYIIGAGAKDCKFEIDAPFLYTWGTKDIFYNHPKCKGGFGITESPLNNKILKKADCIVMIGTRMDTHQVPNWNSFAPQAYKIAVGLEFPHLVNEINETEFSNETIIEIKGPDWVGEVVRPQIVGDTSIYKWMRSLCKRSRYDDIIIPDMGQAGCIAFQAWEPIEGQRLFNGLNHSPMGYSLPASIGAAIATGQRVIAIVGDGSLMMNLQDLQTIVDLDLPINIFVVSNGGYGMIRQTQNDWKEFLNQGVGCNFRIPDIKKIADAFGLKFTDELSDTPSICNNIFEDTRITPKWKYGEEL